MGRRRPSSGSADKPAGGRTGLILRVRGVGDGGEADLLRSLPPLMRPRLGSGMTAAGVLGAAILLNQLDRARAATAVQDALKRFGLDPTSSADAAAVRAYVRARNFGPIEWLDVPWSGAKLDRVAEAVMRLERVSPGTLTRALGGDRGALATLDRAVQAAKEGGATPAPAVQPGSGIETRMDEERAAGANRGMYDLDALKMVDEKDRLGAMETGGAETVIARLREEKPWLFTASTSPAARALAAAGPAAPVDAMEMSYDDWRKARAALLRKQASSR